MKATQCKINAQIFKAKLCSSAYAVKYVNALRYGYDDKAEKFFNILVFLKGAIRIFEDYEISEEKIYAKNSILNRFNKKALLSKNNSLYLNSKNQKIILSEEELNCFSCEELCKLSEKVTSICSTC